LLSAKLSRHLFRKLKPVLTSLEGHAHQALDGSVVDEQLCYGLAAVGLTQSCNVGHVGVA